MFVVTYIEYKFDLKFHYVYLRSRLINITYSHMLGAPQVEKAKDVKLHRTSTACCSYPMTYKTFFPFLYVPVNYISQTPFEIYETTNGRNSPVSASNHFLTHRRGRSPIKAKGAWVYPQGPGT